MTNNYANVYLRTHANLSPGTRARKWTPVTGNKMRGFITTIMNMGINGKPTIESYWSTMDELAAPWFRKMFSRNRFEAILRFFHIVDNKTLASPGDPKYDPCGKFAPLVDHANRVFRRHYIPHREISIDESLIGTKNHTRLLQYLPNKHHHKWGIKLWMLCDSVTKYCSGFSCYKGKENDGPVSEHGLAYKVVLSLLQLGPYLNKGYSLFVDNFFLSIPLADYLYSKCTFITGTLRKNRKGIPPAMKAKFQVGKKLYLRHEQKLMLGYREKASQKNPVLLLTTKSTAKSVEKSKQRNGEVITRSKPEVIDIYNKYMGGVDHSDQMLYAYLDERRSVKYWKKVVFNIFGRMILNLYILYKENNAGQDMTRLKFTVSIIASLKEEWLAEKNLRNVPMRNLGGGDTGAHLPNYKLVTLPEKKERNCIVCTPESKAAGGKRKKSRTICARCEKGVHGVCFGRHQCFM